MTDVIINPGGGPIDRGSATRARLNIEAFIADLTSRGLHDPDVTTSSGRPRLEDDGRYLFVLRRGLRTCDVSMPGHPLEQVRYMGEANQNAWDFPRLYVDGNSWLWVYALSSAARDLYDHDGQIKRRVKASEQRCKATLKACNGRCTTCGTVLEMRQPYVHTDLGEREYELLCLRCKPQLKTVRQTYDGAVYCDDSWKGRPHYLVLKQAMPAEALGARSYADPEALCGRSLNLAGSICRRRYRHDGPCHGYWKVIDETFVPEGSR